MHELGTLRSVDGKPVLRFERQLAHPPETVWRAITEPAQMGRWFPASVETRLAAGAAMRFSFDDDLDLGEKYADGEILEIDEPKVYAFRWVDDVLRFELVPAGAGCLLVFTVTLSGVPTTGDLPSVARTAPGWDACLDTLVAGLDGKEPPAPDMQWFLSRSERYVEEFGLAEGEVRDHRDGSVLRFERDLMQPVAQVWATLVDSETPEVGAPPPVQSTHGYVTVGTVTTAEEPSVLEYTWQHDGADVGRVRFELAVQEPLGTRLVLTQTVPARLASHRATALAAWQTHLELLFAALHGDVRCPWPADRTEHLRAMYAERLDAAPAR